MPVRFEKYAAGLQKRGLVRLTLTIHAEDEQYFRQLSYKSRKRILPQRKVVVQTEQYSDAKPQVYSKIDSLIDKFFVALFFILGPVVVADILGVPILEALQLPS